MGQAVLGGFIFVTHLILDTPNTYYYYPNFTYKTSKAQRD